ncbi:Kre1 protein [Candida orthopsilosis Co 90-125]|uniref:Kre1 protein n=1 Tax=Candida orthopsilosis (strain 90-125) TaxID=1136231 RepID=H8X512_CANO9|nr:Kre1 protein [Candida orthopsilosis Co 90-125]CCG23105.1 Kre1 protein [Candida orthopsilosis Co 90-125]
MKLLELIYSFFLFLALTTAKTTSTTSSSSTATTTTKTSQSNTSVWVTGTDASGITRTTQSVFSQSFKSAYTEAEETPSSGSVGLGSLSGSVGHIRTYDRTTISSGGAGEAVAVGRNFIALNGLFSLIYVLL